MFGEIRKRNSYKIRGSSFTDVCNEFFLLPLDTLKEIERSLSKFWWNNSQDSKLSWMCSDWLAIHKDAGGMGFRNFRNFNLAMLGKQC